MRRIWLLALCAAVALPSVGVCEDTIWSGRAYAWKSSGMLPVPGVKITFYNSRDDYPDNESNDVLSIPSDSSGYFICYIPYGWGGYYSATKDGCTIVGFWDQVIGIPSVQERDDIVLEVAVRVEYKAVDSDNAPLNYVTMNVGDNTMTTGGDGSGVVDDILPYGWSGTITPSKTGYTFDPPSIQVTNLTYGPRTFTFTGYPSGTQPPAPTDESSKATPGIWKSADGALNLYLQKYQTGSAALVVLYAGRYAAFVDSDYSDGISAADDVLSQGLTLKLTCTDDTHGTLDVDLPGIGHVTTWVTLFVGRE